MAGLACSLSALTLTVCIVVSRGFPHRFPQHPKYQLQAILEQTSGKSVLLIECSNSNFHAKVAKEVVRGQVSMAAVSKASMTVLW